MSEKLKISQVKSMKSKFNKGDVIRVTSRPTCLLLLGTEHTVTEFNDQGAVMINTRVGKLSYQDSHFELVRSESLPKFMAGDRVRLRKTWSDYLKAGAEGIVRDPAKDFGGLCGRLYVDVRWDRTNPQVHHNAADGGYDEEQLDLVVKSRKLDQQTDPDLHRGYTEECSSYRACRGEGGAWIIEASRVKIIAQCSDEAEARRIEQALNSSRSEAL